jgi:phosphomannomutase/GT2 family glycosyltransferase
MKSTGHYKKWFQAMNNNLQTLSCFKAYDIRGKLGDELNEDIAYRIGRAVAQQLKPKTIVVGGDARETSKSLKLAVAKGLQDAGVDVIDIGMVGTEEIYFATSFLKVDGGIEITASHNPINYNGMKLVREQSKPISGDTGLNEIRVLAEQQPWLEAEDTNVTITKGRYKQLNNLSPYVQHLMTYVNPENITPLKLVVNSGNGAAGHVIDEIESQFKLLNVPIEFIKVHHQPDHTFPNGIPNPLLPENRADTADAVIEHKADMGIAWDGDFDRCFLFDETGAFIEGYYIVGLLAEAFLQKNANEKIIYDPRVYWNTEDIIKKNGGFPVMSKTGHAFIKERMRQEDAVYGGEMSAHHYFRDFSYCDSGMIPWLLVAELICVKHQPLSAMVKDRIAQYPSSGEINMKVADADLVINTLEENYKAQPESKIDYTDGINIIFNDWRFNLRKSNTESLIRLNVETNGNINKMKQKVKQLVKTIANVKTTNRNLRGAIDTFSDGIIRGWAICDDSDETLKVHLICDEKIIGTGSANIFRKDLYDNGINTGHHSFEIAVDDVWPLDVTGIDITLIEADTLKPIKGASNHFMLYQERLYADILKIENGHVVTELYCGKIIGHKDINLYHEDQLIHSFNIDSNKKREIIRQPLPIHLIDGKHKLYKIGVTGIPHILGIEKLTAYPIQTPWQYIKDSYNKPGFLSMPQQADSRYESLHFQLEVLANESSKLSAKNLITIHKVIIEGYEGRTNFPCFSLPKFDKPEVSIIVPAYNQFELTYHCIASIALAYNKTSYEVILADDCSTDETVTAETIIENLVISKNPENLRFLRSCNRASEIAKGDYLILLNNDTEVSSYWVDELVSKMKQDNAIGMTGSKLLNLDGTLQEAGGIVWETGEPWNVGRNANPLTPEYNYAREVDYLTGAAMCIRTDVWKQVGLFSEELVPCYYEDTDLAFKVRDAGFKTVYVPHSVVVHFEGQSHGTDVTKGLKRYQVINEATFRQKWFKAFRSNGSPSLENLAYEKDRNIDQRVLVIDYASPMPNKDAGSYAAIQEIKLIQSLGFKVTFVPANLAHFGKYTTELQQMGVEVLYAPFYHSVNHVLEQRLQEMDAVYITRYHIAQAYIPYIKQNSQAKIVFNNADLHFLREMRAALKGGTHKEKLEAALITRDQELSVCQEADAVLCYNATEHAVITSHILTAEKLHITPWVLEAKPAGLSFEKRQGIAFLGGYNHAPNGEAVEYLVNDIMPLLTKQRPDIVLYVYGSSMPASFKEWETNNIKMVGFAETLDGVYHDHRVFVAPLLSGAGIKGKVLESMAYNLPTVLTEVAAEGTGLTHGISTLIAQEPQEWVEAIIQLYDDQTLWTKFSENSQTLVEAKYSFEHGHKAFKKIFASVGVYSSK